MNPAEPDWNLFQSDLTAVLPECILILGMCLVLLVPFILRKSLWGPTIVTAVTLLFAWLAVLLLTFPDINKDTYGPVFFESLMIDPFSQFFKVILLMFTLLVILQWLITSAGEVDVLDVPDFMCLLLGATTGMALMASANNLLMVVVAIETASLPSFVLAGFRKGHRTGSESSLKYVLFGAASSAIMIYGMSLIYGCTGSLVLGDVAAAAGSNMTPLLAIGLAAMFAGFAFKLSAVPMHFWCPDVFQAAPVAVTTFLSVASKGAAMVLLLRVLTTFHAPGSATIYGMAVGIALLGGVTATWGNIMAIQQTHIRRLLAYSSIAHAGYMILAASVVALPTSDPGQVRSAILFYLLVYMFMNLGAFSVGAVIHSQTGTEDIRDYAGLIHRSPWLALLMTVFLLSLFGMPGLGGFMGKVYLMTAMVKIGAPGYVLIAVLLLNTLISLYYYLRPIYYMIQAKDTENRPAFTPSLFATMGLVICALMLFWTGILPDSIKQKVDDFSVVAPRDYQKSMTQLSTQARSPHTQDSPRIQ